MLFAYAISNYFLSKYLEGIRVSWRSLGCLIFILSSYNDSVWKLEHVPASSEPLMKQLFLPFPLNCIKSPESELLFSVPPFNPSCSLVLVTRNMCWGPLGDLSSSVCMFVFAQSSVGRSLCSFHQCFIHLFVLSRTRGLCKLKTMSSLIATKTVGVIDGKQIRDLTFTNSLNYFTWKETGNMTNRAPGETFVMFLPSWL